MLTKILRQAGADILCFQSICLGGNSFLFLDCKVMYFSVVTRSYSTAGKANVARNETKTFRSLTAVIAAKWVR